MRWVWGVGRRRAAAAGAAALASSLAITGTADAAVRLDRVLSARLSKAPLTRIAAGDIDGDGLTDLAVSGTEGVTLVYGDRNVLLADRQFVVPADRRPTAMAIGDLDGDGLGDLAVSAVGAPGNRLCRPCTVVRYGAKRGTVVHAQKVFDARAQDLAIGPLSGDPVLDLIGTPLTGSTLLLGRGVLGGPPILSKILVGGGPADRLGRMAVGDLDGDGRADDLVIADPGSGVLRVVLDFSTDAMDIFAPAPVPVCCAGFDLRLARLAVGDVNGDGRPDIVISDPRRHGGGVGVLLGTGAAQFGPLVKLPPTGHGGAVIAVADIDGDGTAEIITGHSDGLLAARDYEGGAAEVDLGSRITALATGDVDGDGRPEIAATDAKGRIDLVRVTPLPAGTAVP